MEIVKNSDPTIGHQGFILTKIEKLINWARSGSLWPIIFGSSCCGSELLQVQTSDYDLEQMGVILQSDPKHADVIIVAGILTNKMAPMLRNIYDKMSFPKWVISVGSCANGGGAYHNSYSVVRGCDRIIPVDIYVPGCPPTPESLIYGIMQLQNKIKKSTIYSR